MTDKNSTVRCMALAVTLGLWLFIPLTPHPHPPLEFSLIVDGQTGQSLWSYKVGLLVVKYLPRLRKTATNLRTYTLSTTAHTTTYIHHSLLHSYTCVLINKRLFCGPSYYFPCIFSCSLCLDGYHLLMTIITARSKFRSPATSSRLSVQ
jgi:hypothetical protein